MARGKRVYLGKIGPPGPVPGGLAEPEPVAAPPPPRPPPPAQPAERPGTVDGLTLARFWKCSEDNVRDYAKKGVAVRVSKGRYLLMESSQNLIVHQREMITRRRGDDGEINAVTESGKLKAAQRQLMEMRIAERAGRFLPREEIEEAWGILVVAVRNMVMGLPGRIRFDLPHLTLHDRNAIEAVCRSALEECAVSGQLPGGEAAKA